MKNTIKNLGIIVLLAFVTFSFTAIGGKKKVIKSDKSSITWKGHKLTGSHEGTIAIESGTLSFDGKILTGGEFVVDMTSISVTDLEGEYKGKLEGHLKADDFFGVDKHPIAYLTFTKVVSKGGNNYDVTADLKIKDKTNPVTFMISVNDNKATAILKVDRTKYGIKYGSASFFDDLKDKAINDEFDLNVNLEF